MMVAYPCRVGQRVRCGDVAVLGTVSAIRGDGYVIDVSYDDGLSGTVHLYDAVVVAESSENLSS